MSDLAGQVAIVTGGAGGIGEAICRRLAQDGFHVIVNYRSGEAHARRIVEAINAGPLRAMAVQAEASSR